MLKCMGLKANATKCTRNAKQVIVWEPTYNQVECLCNQHYAKVQQAIAQDTRWLVEPVCSSSC